MIKKTISSSGHRQRLRDRFAAGEPNAQTEAALLELLLTYALPQKDVQPLVKALLARFGSLADVLAADVRALCQVSGIKENTAILLKVVDKARRLPVEGQPHAVAEAAPPRQESLFAAGLESEAPGLAAGSLAPGAKGTRRPQPTRLMIRRGSEVFSQALLHEAVDLLPNLPPASTLEQARAYFQKHLHFSSEGTRRRYVSYILRQTFPQGIIDPALPRFAAQFAGQQELRDACFYRFLRAEPLMLRIMQEVIVPAVPHSRIARADVKAYIASHYPESGNASACAEAVAAALDAANFAKVNRAQLTFFYRDVALPSLAFLIHSEFPEPGMYDLGQLEQNPYLRAMLWNPDRLQAALYELRNHGWLAKVSMIDTVRQFTTRYTLEQMVEKIKEEG